MKKQLLTIALGLVVLAIFAAAPVVTGDYNGTDVPLVYVKVNLGSLDVHYNLAADNACTVTMEVSEDGGATYTIFPTKFSLDSDIGAVIDTGTGKKITWYPGQESYTVTPHAGYVVKVCADDGNDPSPIPGFVLVQGGTFNNGTSNVTISKDFYVDKFEVTQKGYADVMGSWDPNPPGSNTGLYGIGDDNPVYNVTWFNAIEYCNRRSIQKGLTPVYSYDTNGTDPTDWPTGWNTNANHINFTSNWNANGYRLLTEMEWMYAAKGGHITPGTGYNTYSGTNTESNLGDYAWYTINNIPEGTKEVGGKLANQLGIFDMSGNVWEWVWDRYASSYPTGAQTDPHGATSGTERVRRGGAYPNAEAHITVAKRNKNTPDKIWQDMGFRVGRSTITPIPVNQLDMNR